MERLDSQVIFSGISENFMSKLVDKIVEISYIVCVRVDAEEESTRKKFMDLKKKLPKRKLKFLL